MVNFRRFLAVVILLSVAALAVVIYRHVEQQSPEELLTMLPENVDLSLDDLHYTQNEDGRRIWTLDADKAEYLRDTDLAKLESVKVLFYKQGEFGDIALIADRGELQQQTRQIYLRGNVVVTTGRGDRLLTDTLHYDDQNRRLTTEDPVEMISEQAKVTGIGLRIDVDKGRMVVKKNVHAFLYPATTE